MIKGVLTLNERGNVNGSIVSISPHPEFRLFLIVDPLSGDLSRPLRNRGLELYIPKANPEQKNWNLSKMKILNKMTLFTSSPKLSLKIFDNLESKITSRKFETSCISVAKRFRDLTSVGVSVDDALGRFSN